MWLQEARQKTPETCYRKIGQGPTGSAPHENLFTREESGLTPNLLIKVTF